MTQVYVGATNVGSMTFKHEPELKTNTRDFSRKEKTQEVRFETPINIQKGEEVGMFKLGSTVVLIFEAPANLEWTRQKGEHIRFGEVFAKFD